jgi:serine protease inhibitor
MGTSLKVILLAALVWSTVSWCRGTAREVNAVEEAPTAAVAVAGNDFGFRLLGTLNANGTATNLIVSPLSVSQALTMTYNGARGSTKTAMARTLGIGAIDVSQLNASNRQLLEALHKADPDARLEIANALWLQKDLAVAPQFVALTKGYYGAAVRSLDFAGNPLRATEMINAWVSRNTQGKIPSIVDRLEPNTALVLTNAVYFKGGWSEVFDPQESKPRAFFGPDGKSAATPMMEQDGFYSYLETNDFQGIRLPYGNGQFAMYVFLPRARGGLGKLLKSLDKSHWAEWTKKFASSSGTIVLPKFEVRYGEKLNAVLEAMGMGVAFNKEEADFSGITPSHIYISDVEHKTYVKVDEKGTEAAASTAVVMRLLSKAMIVGGKSFSMVVDHPFAFAIAERGTGAILFVGTVVDPNLRQ